MSDNVITVENLSKSYLIGHRSGQVLRRPSLRDVVAHHARDLVRRAADTFSGRPMLHGDTIEEFWALSDVSFEVERGEMLGIIGGNGAGKSTLLKILSRVTEPTRGRAYLKGRVSSLLEVGTGFHSELTGRENIFLNGAILGMSRREILGKFDEIVAFAEVEKFVDTPVKQYSSGMYVRLAFAVAAHLEPEILLIDEVLAIGDTGFQRRCIEKMRSLQSARSTTLLFVTHNLQLASSLCPRSILLKEGRLLYQGSTAELLSRYMLDFRRGGTGFSTQGRREQSTNVQILGASVSQDGADTSGSQIFYGRPFCIFIEVGAQQDTRFSVEMTLRDSSMHSIAFVASGLEYGWEAFLKAGQKTTVRVDISAMELAEGNYYVDLMLAETGVRFYDQIEGALRFEIAPTSIGPHHWRFLQRGAGAFRWNAQFSEMSEGATT